MSIQAQPRDHSVLVTQSTIATQSIFMRKLVVEGWDSKWQKGRELFLGAISPLSPFAKVPDEVRKIIFNKIPPSEICLSHLIIDSALKSIFNKFPHSEFDLSHRFMSGCTAQIAATSVRQLYKTHGFSEDLYFSNKLTYTNPHPRYWLPNSYSSNLEQTRPAAFMLIICENDNPIAIAISDLEASVFTTEIQKITDRADSNSRQVALMLTNGQLVECCGFSFMQFNELREGNWLKEIIQNIKSIHDGADPDMPSLEEGE